MGRYAALPRLSFFTRRALLGAIVAIAAFPSLAHPDALPSRNDGANKTRIVRFVEDVTNPASRDFVPPAERVAVFDTDGTLRTEQPRYFQLAFVFDRARALAPPHPEWKTTERFKSVPEGNLARVAASGDHGLVALAGATHGDTTPEAFMKVVSDWLATARHPRFKRPYTELTFAPMKELMAYRRANGFMTFIVSGGGIEFMRVFSERVYGVPPEQVVGSYVKMKYELRNGRPVIVRQSDIDFIDDKAGKPVGIDRFSGRRPILAFGNSAGDFEMLEYVTSGPGPRLGLILHHDDAGHEYAYDRQSPVGLLERGLDEAPQRGWAVVSMKDDWRTTDD
jgi:hypothetical protein